MDIFTKIRILRFLGYIGVCFNSILVPLLIFKMTNSMLLAGIAISIEWVPKLLFYLFGGAVIHGFSATISHKKLDIYRLWALIILFCATQGWVHWIMVAIASALYQSANAVSNILFENLVTLWHKTIDHPIGHSQLMRADLKGSIFAMLFSLFLNDLVLIAGVALILQSINLIFVYKWVDLIYSKVKITKVTFTQIINMTKNAYQHINEPLAKLAFFSLTVGLPVAALSSIIPFYFNYAYPVLEVTPRDISLFILLKLVSSLVFSYLIHIILDKYKGSSSYLAVFSILMLFFGMVVSYFSTGMIAIVGLLIISYSSYFYSPWARTLRQSLLPKDLSVRMSLTGMLLSMEASSYLVGGVIISFSGGNIHTLLLFVFFPLIVSSLVWLKFYGKRYLKLD